MIHIRDSVNAGKTACGLIVTSKKDQWGHALASDSGPLTEFRTCVNCPACEAVVPARHEVVRFEGDPNA